MGKPSGRKKLQTSEEKVIKQNKISKNVDEDTVVFIQMSQEMKEEGNKLFKKHDYEGAMLKYEKGLNLLPSNHIDVAYLRVKMANCYMQLGLKEYPRAINECNLALEVAPKYSKALINRAKCYRALNKFDWASRDVKNVLVMEPNNLAALEIEDSVKKSVEGKGLKGDDVGVPEYIERKSLKKVRSLKEKIKNKKKKADEKVIVEDKMSIKEEKVVTRTVKMVLGDDIRWAEVPVDCSIGLVREIVRDRFPGLDGVLIKYKDQEGDLITIVTTNELRLAENLSDPQGSFRLYLVEVSSDKEPFYEGMKKERLPNTDTLLSGVTDVGKDGELEKGTTCIEEWIVQFARLFKNHVGFDTNPYLDLHELGMELYSEAMEDSVTTESSQNLFDIAGEKFQEMSALALFNWGNVHMNKARKLVVVVAEDGDGICELVSEKVKVGYEWAQKEYVKAGKRYEESLKIKPDFYEGHLALGQQQFEQAKLTWHYVIGSKADLEVPSIQILELYNKAEDNMEKGMQIWEELEERRLNGLSLSDKHRVELIKVGLEGIIKDDEAAEQSVNIRSQIYILWGTLLYERSVVEYKLSLPSWEECLEVAVEKFELAGVSHTDLTVIIKNHCSNVTALEGLSFKIDEIVQAWNEMFDTKRWQTGVPSFRLEPLFRRRVPKLHSLMEHL